MSKRGAEAQDLEGEFQHFHAPGGHSPPAIAVHEQG